MLEAGEPNWPNKDINCAGSWPKDHSRKWTMNLLNPSIQYVMGKHVSRNIPQEKEQENENTDTYICRYICTDIRY